MNLKKIVAQATVAGALGFAALGLGAGVANADPPPPYIPWQPGHEGPGYGHDGYDGAWQDRGHDGNWRDGGDNRRLPWGWGPPPRPDWRGPLPPPWGPPPPPFDYWGQTVYPVWEPGFQAWGFWFLGLWIPLI
jgi:hypothetical protein